MATSKAPAGRKPAARMRAAPACSAGDPGRSLLESLGLVGLAGIEPVVLAALATETPLLLIGAHGSAKSLLLERLAIALGLAWRHYNAALVNYDDLIGYPLPDEHGGLRFVPTPASIWEAEAVFVDEISRARVDMQNRLFPIIHERRVQGMALEKLRHRWAAMNPPMPSDAEPDAQHYAGSQPLDLALADRFAWHVPMPDWRGLSEVEQERIICADPEPGAPDGVALRRCLDEACALLPVVRARWSAPASRYVRIVCGMLETAGMRLSARRAGVLLRNLLAVHAVWLSSAAEVAGAARAVDTEDSMADSAWLALAHSLPLAACGQPVQAGTLLASHREAWRLAAVAPDDPLAAVLTERDPARRVQLALRCGGLEDGELTAIVVDALAQLPPGASHALAEWLLETGALPRLSVVAADEAGARYRALVAPDPLEVRTRMGSPRWRVWKGLEPRLARLDPSDPIDLRLANLIVHLFRTGALVEDLQAEAVVDAYRGARATLGVEARRSPGAPVPTEARP